MARTSSGARRGDRPGESTRLRPIRVTGPEPAEAPFVEQTSPTYESARRYLDERMNVERVSPSRVPPDAFKLDRMRALLEALGNPQRDVRCVHIAGSKGKGSVAEMTASCLSACGYATGLFTSPHLVDVRERVRINGEMISPEVFTGVLHRCARAAETVRRRHGEATYFELLTALALAHFAGQAVDIAVMEVGLGGRLDSTNVVEPEVTAVTAIQLEHTQLLGDTVEKIAREKAGIFKPGVAALTVPQAAPVLAVLREVAGQVSAPLQVLGEDIEFSYRFEADAERGPHARVCLNTSRSSYEHLPVPFKGEHQAPNCGLALAILDRLRDRGFEAPERAVAEGLARTNTAGRMEMVSRSPRVIVDGAHTTESVSCLMRSIGQHLRYDSMVAIFGCSDDKDIRGMLQRLSSGADKVIFTRAAGTARAMDPRELARRFAEVSGKMVQVARGLPDALAIAGKAVARDDLICITGSFYLVGEAKRLLGDSARDAGAKRPDPR